MRRRTKVISSLVASALLMSPSVVSAKDFTDQRGSLSTSLEAPQSTSSEPIRSFAMVLTDHPGRATALTDQQMTEIREIVSRSAVRGQIVCAGVSLSGQRESMYRVVRLRAQLVCNYAQALEPSLVTTVIESFTPSERFNGRVVVVSRLPDTSRKPSSNRLHKF